MNINEKFKNAIDDVKTVVVTTHIIPDADGIGSQVALCLALRELKIDAICVVEEPLQERYLYLDSEKCIESYDSYSKKKIPDEIDLLIVVDTNSVSRIGPKMQNLTHKSKNQLFIDHHPCPPVIMSLHCIDISTAATGEIIGRLIEFMNIPFTKNMALPLYTAILIDSSSFRYPKVSSETHRLTAKLMDTGGVEPPKAFNMINGTKKISYFQLLGSVLRFATTNRDHSIAWIILREQELKNFNIDIEDTYSFINYLLVLDKVQIACMFTEQKDYIKLSLRSAINIDVGVMAHALGGGGHDHSAATILKGPIEDVVKKTIFKLEIMLESLKKND